MAQANLANALTSIETGLDNIVIVDKFQSIRGGFSLDVTGFKPVLIRGGHPIIEETSTGQLKPMPATEGTADGVATVDTLVEGAGYTNGVYENVPLTTIGAGTEVLATVTVALTVVSAVAITKAGKGYSVNDTLTVPAAHAGGTATTNATVDVATIASTAGAFGTLPAGHTYEGVTIHTDITTRPQAGVLVRGTVNHVAFTAGATAGVQGYYDYSTILAAIRAALPRMDFRGDR